MAKKLLVGGGLLLLLATTFYAGFATGNRWTFGWMIGMLETEVAGSQNYRLTQLADIRSGNVERAIHLIEKQVDSALSSLPRGRGWDKLPELVRNTLVVSKKYRELYPPAEPSPSLKNALAFIPDLPLDPKSCSPAVRHLLERGSQQGSESQ